MSTPRYKIATKEIDHSSIVRPTNKVYGAIVATKGPVVERKIMSFSEAIKYMRGLDERTPAP